jgi:carbamoylphosphate synthase large subunit
MSNITGKALASKLGLKYCRKEETISRLARKGIYPAIRYGNSTVDLGDKDTKLNSPKVIRLCSDSVRFSKFCIENDIYTPEYKKFNSAHIPGLPFLLRNRTHRSGLDINIINNNKDLERLSMDRLVGRYWVPIIETEYEIRVHYVLGDIVRIFVKRPGINARENSFIRTLHHGWHYSIKENAHDDNKWNGAKKLAHKIAETTGLAFGGIDMAYIRHEKRYIVWEVNTAPGLNANTLELYASRLREELYG